MGDKERMEQYKKEILTMVEEIQVSEFVSMIYGFVKGLHEEEKRRGG